MKLLKEIMGGNERAILVDKVKQLNRDLKNNKPTPVFVKWVDLRDRVINGKSIDEVSTSDLKYLVKSGNQMNHGERKYTKTWDM